MRETKVIAFEGIDNCGKDTLMHKLKYKLAKDYRIAMIPSVTATDIGKLVRVYGRCHKPNKEQLVLLYMADFYSKLEMIQDCMNEYDLIFCSRWFSSTMAYCEDSVKQVAIKSMLKDTLRPDVTFYIKIPVEESLKRQHKGFKITDIYSNNKVLEEASFRYDNIFQDSFFNAIELDGMDAPNLLVDDAKYALMNKKIIYN